MKNIVLVGLVLIVFVILLFRTKSFDDTPAPMAPGPSSIAGPRNNQQWYFVAATASCPEGYSKPDPTRPTICKLNNS